MEQVETANEQVAPDMQQQMVPPVQPLETEAESQDVHPDHQEEVQTNPEYNYLAAEEGEKDTKEASQKEEFKPKTCDSSMSKYNQSEKRASRARPNRKGTEDFAHLQSAEQRRKGNKSITSRKSEMHVGSMSAAGSEVAKAQKGKVNRGMEKHRESTDMVARSNMTQRTGTNFKTAGSEKNHGKKGEIRSQSSRAKLVDGSKGMKKADGKSTSSKVTNKDNLSITQPISSTSNQVRNSRQNTEKSRRTGNEPASPASKPTDTKINLQIQPPPRDGSQLIAEVSEDLSPQSCGPRLNSPQDHHMQPNIGFGIKLQKVLDEPERVVYPQTQERPKEEETTTVAGDNNSDTASKANGSHKLPEPLPLLPKVTNTYSVPPKCPIDSIRFIQLKRFQMFTKAMADKMSEGFDLVGQRRKMLQMKTEDKLKKPNQIDQAEQLAKMDENTHYIKNIVYARDPTIIDQETGLVNQRAAFSHLNTLDIKQLIRKKELLDGESNYCSISPRALQRRFNNQKPEIRDAQIHKVMSEEDKTLIFESRFESGNMYLAQKVSDQEYNLLMQNDVNTSGHTQWFFFQVRNTRAKNKVRFNILNYSKVDSLFNYGMKVSVYSERKAETGLSWHKDGEDIRYFANNIRKDVTYYSKGYYTLTFSYTFEHDHDTVYFAYSVPYTFSDLRNDLVAIETDPARSLLVTKKELCKTLSGESCDILTITSRDNLENFPQRKGVIITGRVHPGETVGSWMMRGVLTFLTDPNNEEARILRENFVFKVIPMLNPDGVINGNYRCSLAGCDLNRRWKTPSKILHPTIFYTKKLVKQIHQERGLVLFCDLHGHSRKQNVFMYGCNNKQNPGECRIFPYILSHMNPYFSFEYSRFGVQKSKEATARVALYKELKNVPNIYTMESSFAGVDMGKSAGMHLTTDMLETLGHDCCRALLIICNLYMPPELTQIPFFKAMLAKWKQRELDKGKGFSEDKEPDLKDLILGELNSNKKLLEQADGDSSSGSDSAPSEDNMQAEELIKQLPTVDKTLKQQLKKNQERKKQEESQQAQSTVKLRRQSSVQAIKKQTEPKRNLSPYKKATPIVEKQAKEEPKPDAAKKPKPEMRDAQTQTDRSDYQQIKAKWLREQALKAKLAAQQQLSDSQKSPLKQEQKNSSQYKETPNNYTGYQTSSLRNTNQGGSTQSKQISQRGHDSRMVVPDSKKYDFIGVNSLRGERGKESLMNDTRQQQNMPNNLKQQSYQGFESDYGHQYKNSIKMNSRETRADTQQKPSTDPTALFSQQSNSSSTQPHRKLTKRISSSQRENNPGPASSQENMVDARKSKNDHDYLKNNQFPSMQSNLPNTSVIKEVENPVMMIAQMQGPQNRMHQQNPSSNNTVLPTPKGEDTQSNNNSPNFKNYASNGGANLFGGLGSMPKHNFMLPQTKQVPQHQFVMDLGSKSAKKPGKIQNSGPDPRDHRNLNISSIPGSGNQRRTQGRNAPDNSSVKKIINILGQQQPTKSATLNQEQFSTQPMSVKRGAASMGSTQNVPVISSSGSVSNQGGNNNVPAINHQMRQSMQMQEREAIPSGGVTGNESHFRGHLSVSSNNTNKLPALNVRSNNHDAHAGFQTQKSQVQNTPSKKIFQLGDFQQSAGRPQRGAGLVVTNMGGSVVSQNRTPQSVNAKINKKVLHSESCHKPNVPNHVRITHQDIFHMQSSSTGQNNSNLQGTRTPSSQGIERKTHITTDNHYIAGKKTIVTPANQHFGSISLEGSKINEQLYDANRSNMDSNERNVHGSEQRGVKEATGMLPRFRNASEIGETRNAKNNNYGTFDQQARANPVMSPPPSFNKKGMMNNHLASPPNKTTVAQRYSKQ